MVKGDLESRSHRVGRHPNPLVTNKCRFVLDRDDFFVVQSQSDKRGVVFVATNELQIVITRLIQSHRRYVLHHRDRITVNESLDQSMAVESYARLVAPEDA